MLRRAALLSLVIAGALAAPAPAALETVLQDDPGLLHRSDELTQANAARMKQLGVDRVRITASWSSLTRDPESDSKPAGFDAADPAAYEQSRWAALDRAVRVVRANGMKVLIDIGFWAPHWATDDPPGPRARTNIDPAAFADFATAVARRYSGGFTPVADAPGTPPAPPNEDQTIFDDLFGVVPPIGPVASVLPGFNRYEATGPLPLVDQYVIWNEPNIPALLLPQWSGSRPASPTSYRAMVRAAYPAVKAVRPGLQVLIGNTSSTGGRRGTGAVAPLEFLRELACVDARLKPRATPECRGFTAVPGDGWSHHPYSQNERPTRRSSPITERGDIRLADLPQLDRTLRALVRARRLASGNAAIHLTEFGYETSPIKGRPTIGTQTAARWLTWGESIADAIPSVRSWAQFLLRDQPPAKDAATGSAGRPGGEFYSGLLFADGRDKPSAKFFRAGLYAQRKGRAQVSVYVRLRLGPGRRAIAVQRRIGQDRWRTVVRASVDGRQAFRRATPYRTGARYRLRYPDAGKAQTSLSVPVENPPR